MNGGIKQIQRENWNIIVSLYREYSSSAVLFLQQYISDTFKCEELVHDAFEKMLKMTEPLDHSIIRSRNLLFTIAKNKAIDYIKRHKNEKVKYREIYLEHIQSDKFLYKDLEDSYLEGEVVSTLHDAIRDLPHDIKKVILDEYFEGESILSISKKMSISPYKVRRKRLQALEKLEQTVNHVITE